ncbi:MAG: hypothetical protein H6658_17980 [Ardenticatenaceae bacterium]|nr:hypothetical protein [Ardenticatenaceae bacterium]
MSTSPYDFEQFPRRLLHFRFDRRQLFTNVKIEMDVAIGEQQGGKGYKLSTLGVLPDAELGSIIPMILPDCQISLKDGFVWSRQHGSANLKRLFPQEETMLYVFNGINGRTSLDHIAAYLQQQTSWDAARSFAFTRGLFLHLVQLQTCVPRPERVGT